MIKTTALAKSMKRLFEAGRITKEDVAKRVESGRISTEEYAYITGESYER